MDEMTAVVKIEKGVGGSNGGNGNGSGAFSQARSSSAGSSSSGKSGGTSADDDQILFQYPEFLSVSISEGPSLVLYLPMGSMIIDHSI